MLGNYNIFQMSRYPRLREEVERIVNTRIREQEQRVKEQLSLPQANTAWLGPITRPIQIFAIQLGSDQKQGPI
jgi:hypothetical protein